MSGDQRSRLEQLLLGGSLEDKLLTIPVAPLARDGRAAALVERVRQPEFLPIREGALAFSQERAAFPKLTAGSTAAERGKALHFFANHELLAIELLAYAALKYPDDPPGLHASLLRTLAEEQTHLRMYIERMAELGVTLGDFPLNGHFWQLLAPAQNAVAFSCGMNLTFEQANLDFAHYYQQKFAAIGDPVTAQIMATIAEDEISHVSRGVYIVKKSLLSRDEQGHSPSLWAMYRQHLPEAISPMRAKGTAFDRKLRQRAHLDDQFIGELYAYRESASQTSRLFYYNPDCEREINNPHYSRSPLIAARIADLEYLLTLVTRPGDAVVVSREPSLAWRQHLQGLGLPVAQPLLWAEGQLNEAGRKYMARNFCAAPTEFHPWGQTPQSAKIAVKLATAGSAQGACEAVPRQLSERCSPRWYSKLELPTLRHSLRSSRQGDDQDAVAVPWRGEVVTTLGQLEAQLAKSPSSVIKAPYGAAGSGLFYLDGLGNPADATATRFVEAWLGAGKALLWEPRCKVVSNYSAVGWLMADGESRLDGLTRFTTTGLGQYAGHELAPAGQDRRLAAISPILAKAFAHAGRFLADLGYCGPFGIDAFDYQAWQNPGEVVLQPLGEINSRYTMGHMAAVLQSKMAAPGRWAFLSLSRLQAAGFPSPAAFGEWALDTAPIVSKGGKWQQGIALLSDWQQGEAQGLSVLSVGENATKLVPFN